MGKSTPPPPTAQAQPSSQTVTQSNIPEYARPYYERLLSRAESTSQNAYVPYEGQRIAPLTAPQQEGMALANENIGVAQPYLQQAGTAITGAAGQASGTYGYRAPGITSQYQAGSYTPTPVPTAVPYTPAASYTPAERYTPTSRPPSTAVPTAASYTPTAGIMQPAQMWNQDVAQQYMNPYQQSVIDIGKREATRQSGIASLQDQTRATQAGGYGGYRQGIVESEAQRNLQQRLSDIQTQGNQAGYQQAGQMFGADRAAQLASAQAAQQASQFGYGTGESARQFDYGANEAARKFDYGAAEAAGQFGYGATESARQFGYGANEAARKFDYESAQKARQFDYDAAQRASQFGYGATESARQAQGQQGIAAQQANAAAQAQAAQIGLGAGQLGIQAGQGLGALGTTTQKAGAADVASLMGMGEVERQSNQQGLNLAYQDFLAQQYYPQQQEQYLSSILRGSVINPSTMQTTYQAPYDPVSQALSMGLGGIGLMKAFG